jgi:CubicO group peptidase (beta-lactamase class C family)
MPAMTTPIRPARPWCHAWHRWLGLCLLAASGLAMGQGVFPAASWDRAASPEAVSWSADELKAADRIAAAQQTDSYLVVHRGVLVHAFGDLAKPRNLFSARKSVVGVLIGIAVDRGQIDLDESLASLQVDDVGGLSEAEKSATVRQLLQSRSGVYHVAAYETDEQRTDRPARGSHAPGTFWFYNNWDFNVLGSIFQQRVGKSVFEALRDDLAVPLQFEDFQMSRDTGFFAEPVSRHAAYVVNLSARDLARVGLLMARGGRWGERQQVSQRWVFESTAAASATPAGWHDFASMWWVPRRAWPFWRRGRADVFFASGNHGQFLFVDRRRDLVIVHLADPRRFFSKPVTDDTIGPLLERILAAAPRE